MKMVAEYLERALECEQLASVEKNPRLRVEFEKLAAAYRGLVAERTKVVAAERYSSHPEEK
jgi:hypothetical protein